LNDTRLPVTVLSGFLGAGNRVDERLIEMSNGCI